ncbi:MAG: glucosidase, partial [Proteobacteria bacterium]|nr:glucosidase [Pseudomonadota bacterium]
EDVKELYYFLDATPTHSYCRALYKYPHAEFPYAHITAESKRRTRQDPEFELLDTGVFNENRYFDLVVEYAKNSPNDLLIRITAFNRGPEAAALHLLPTLWFRNTWSWGRKDKEGFTGKPAISRYSSNTVVTDHETLERFFLALDTRGSDSPPTVLFTENETNIGRLFGSKMSTPYVKDSFHDYVIHGKHASVNSEEHGSKCAFHIRKEIPAGRDTVIQLRFSSQREQSAEPFGAEYDAIFLRCIAEADQFYEQQYPPGCSEDEKRVYRQASAGLIWSKQFYYYSVNDWLEGDPTQPAPSRKLLRNKEWSSLYNRDVLSMPDKWEYPWYAAWDLAFHMIPFSKLDPHFAKEQLILMLREWYMHPNGQIPAYEFAFSDVNPPVHAWACWRVYKMTGRKGQRDTTFLKRVFQKLLLNFTWWVNRKDIEGRNLFAGGFLGLDNIGVFDRGQPLPMGGYLEQADGTAWMAFFCGTMLSIALELANEDPSYEDMASKFFEHFISITDAINNFGGTGLWNEEDGFYYDQLQLPDRAIPLKIRSLVGLIPMLAVEVIEDDIIERLPGFRKRMNWFLSHRDDLRRHISYMSHRKEDGAFHSLLAIPSEARLRRMLAYILDENEFLSPYGIRSLSKAHATNPYIFKTEKEEYTVSYVPGESTTTMFGGNSNWRGPVWFPINYLLVEALERYHHFHGELFKIEFPTGSGQMMTLRQISQELASRLSRIFLADERGRRPCHGDIERYRADPAWRDLVLFHEYFHGDSGLGLGASHQTGWTALVTRCLERVKWHTTRRG